MKDYPLTYQQGNITLDNVPDEFGILNGKIFSGAAMTGDFGILIAKDGRVWICINGVAFIRFTPIRKGGWNGVQG